LALRASREERKVICQVFLLTANPLLHIRGAELRLADGSAVSAEAIRSLEETPAQSQAPPISVGFGFGVGGGSSHGGHDFGTESAGPAEWRSSSPGGGGGLMGGGLPIWKLLGLTSAHDTPHSLELVYQLPAGPQSCDGCQFAVFLDLAEKSRSGGPQAGSVGAGTPPATAASEPAGKPLPIIFVMKEKPLEPSAAASQPADETLEATRKLVREIQFNLKEHA
jgi:hypothetical protein